MDTVSVVTTICTVITTAALVLAPTFWFIKRVINGSDQDKREFAAAIKELAEAVSGIREQLATLIPRKEHYASVKELTDKVAQIDKELVRQQTAIEVTQGGRVKP